MLTKKRLDQLVDTLWRDDPAPLPVTAARALRVTWCTLREIGAGDLSLRAMSLVYTTLLSLVPLLALSFSMLKALGVHNRIEPLLLGLLEPLGNEADRIAGLLIGFVDNVKIGVLGSVGIALLFYTVLAMIQKVESSFNHIWRIARTRPLSQRVTEYLVVLLVGPLAISLVLGMTASVSSNRFVAALAELELIGLLLYWLGRLLPYLIIAGIFTFVFAFIPNTRVLWRAAAVGGLVSGVLWQSTVWGFANFVSTASNYNAIYSGFAIVIFLLIWLYLGWLILLTGCQISFFVQHGEYVTRKRSQPRPSPAAQERLALMVMAVIGHRFRRGDAPADPEFLARTTGARPELLYPLLDRMVRGQVLAETASGALLPARNPDQLRLTQLLNCLHDSELPDTSIGEVYRPVDTLARELDQARDQVLGDATVGSLAPIAETPDPKEAHR